MVPKIVFCSVTLLSAKTKFVHKGERKIKWTFFVMKLHGHRLYHRGLPNFLLSVKTYTQLSTPIVPPIPHLFSTLTNPVPCTFLIGFWTSCHPHYCSLDPLQFVYWFRYVMPKTTAKYSCWSFTSINWKEIIVFWANIFPHLPISAPVWPFFKQT